MSDERKGLPSASKFEMLANCPGQQQLQASIGESLETQDDGQNPEAERGTRIHLALERSDNTILLDDGEREAFNRALELEREFLSQWQEEERGISGVEAVRENRLWLRDDAGDDLVSGKLDRLFFGYGEGDGEVHAAIIDFKTGRAFHAGKASENWQLRLQAILAKEFRPHIVSVRCALIVPEVWGGYCDAVDYSPLTLAKWRDVALNVLWLAQQPDAPRRAGKWCLYCPCKAFCPEAAARALLPSVLSQQAWLDRADMKARALAVADMMSPEDLATVYHQKSVIEAVLKAIATRLVGLPKETLAALELAYREGKKLDKLRDHAAAAAHLQDMLGLSDDQIKSCMELDMSKAIELVCGVTGGTEARAKQWLDKELDPWIDRKRGEPYVQAARK
jgi:hypothetical protein